MNLTVNLMIRKRRKEENGIKKNDIYCGFCIMLCYVMLCYIVLLHCINGNFRKEVTVMKILYNRKSKKVKLSLL